MNISLKILISTKEGFKAVSTYLLVKEQSSNNQEFIFKNIKIKKHGDCVNLNDLKVRISYFQKKISNPQCFYEFEVINIKDCLLEKDTLHFLGEMLSDVIEPYRQGVIDVFSIWQSNQQFDWFALPINAYLKQNYITACFLCSSLSTSLLQKEVYQIDMSLVSEELDLIYLLSIAFLGEGGYLGYSSWTFEDCLLELYKHNGYFDNKKIQFFNAKEIQDINIKNIFEQTRSSLLRFKFIVEVF